MLTTAFTAGRRFTFCCAATARGHRHLFPRTFLSYRRPRRHDACTRHRTRRTGFVTLLRARRSALRRAARRLCGAQAGQRGDDISPGDEAGQRGDQWKRHWRCPPRRQRRRPPTCRQRRRPPTCQLVRATWAAQCHVPGHRAILARGQILIKGGGCNYLGYLPDGMLDDARGRESTMHARAPLAATQPPNQLRQMWQSWQGLILQKCR